MTSPDTPDLTAVVHRADLEWARSAGAVTPQTLSDVRARKIAGAVAAAERKWIADELVKRANSSVPGAVREAYYDAAGIAMEGSRRDRS